MDDELSPALVGMLVALERSIDERDRDIDDLRKELSQVRAHLAQEIDNAPPAVQEKLEKLTPYLKLLNKQINALRRETRPLNPDAPPEEPHVTRVIEMPQVIDPETGEENDIDPMDVSHERDELLEYGSVRWREGVSYVLAGLEVLQGDLIPLHLYALQMQLVPLMYKWTVDPDTLEDETPLSEADWEDIARHGQYMLNTYPGLAVDCGLKGNDLYHAKHATGRQLEKWTHQANKKRKRVEWKRAARV